MKKQLINIGRTGNKLLARFGFQIVRYVPVSGGYISAKDTVEAAAKNNQSVTDYVETMWQERGIAQQVIDCFKDFGALSPSTKRVCEIGTGTGMFAETILKSCDISQYESYEIDKDWAEWLSITYKIVSHPANGESLDCTDSNSLDLVHANGVLVYTPFLITIKYFLEISRVTKSEGFAVFDILCEECFDENLLRAWLDSPHLYPCILPKEYVKDFFTKNGFCYIGEFFRKFGIGKSLYLLFKKQ
ncbi:MAG: class I SAM-dependent methyltransferase [Symplocastrum torsivum CPER-KK1]|jgi:SAM-dependent methyltransferase|uniref:Class I SAM-dependent methyltransferase n=1 Tax=Symplocastrum torsivum CPER-KK1 TaxID=450513 RepID=A0A951UBB8_9CYAN|nr:class I SAM-dependent methyltransferase [Symplocastrum torsivum CPER-KK1]